MYLLDLLEQYVFLMLGVNSIKNYVSIGKFYKDLTQVYKRVNFYAFSVVGINEGSSKNINDVINIKFYCSIRNYLI